jgi:hypothetical protein
MVTASIDLDRLTILERLNRYAWGYDGPDLEMLRDSFTSDASFSMYLEDGKEWGPFRGRDLIVDWMAGVKKTQSDQRRHSITNVLFDDIADAHATVRCVLVLTAAQGGKVRLVTTGRYRIEMNKERQTWRIRKLELFLDAPF